MAALLTSFTSSLITTTLSTCTRTTLERPTLDSGTLRFDPMTTENLDQANQSPYRKLCVTFLQANLIPTQAPIRSKIHNLDAFQIPAKQSRGRFIQSSEATPTNLIPWVNTGLRRAIPRRRVFLAITSPRIRMSLRRASHLHEKSLPKDFLMEQDLWPRVEIITMEIEQISCWIKT